MAKRGYRGKHPHNDMKVSKHSRSMNKTNPTCIKAAGANPNTTLICDPALAVVASGNLIYEAFTIAALTKIVQLPGPRAL